jgi:hypothetical protein
MGWCWDNFACPNATDIPERDKTPMLALWANSPQPYDEPVMLFNI